MMIWLLALVLMGSLAGIGYRQGGIRVACSFLGILVGAVLAGPLGKLVKPLFVMMGAKNPLLPWLLGPPIAFVLISIAFKVAAFTVHRKVDVYYKYHAGDLRLALWERLNRQLGMCVGLLNGAAYTILVAFAIYPFAYWTVQVATSDADPKGMRLLNTLGRDLQASGFAKVAWAVNPMPMVWYDAADFIGMIYKNSLVEARLERYPGFLGLMERSEIQDVANDKVFLQMWQQQDPIVTVLKYPKIEAITQNIDLLEQIWATLVPDLSDVSVYLKTGKSPKYEAEKLLGRWRFSVNAAMASLLRAQPNISSKEMRKAKQYLIAAYSKTSLVAMPDHHAVLKNAAAVRLPGVAGGQVMRCEWKAADGKYAITISGSELPASIEGDRLTIGTEPAALYFDRED
jgi:hypothetical protein